MLGVCHLRWFEQCRQLSHQHDQLDHQSVSSCSHNSPSITKLTFHVDSFGFTVWQTTLLGTVSGAIEILTIWSSVLVIKKLPNARGYVGASYSIPNIVSGILLVALPWTAKGALLFAVYLGGVGTPGFVLSLSWCSTSNTGHTKKATANAMLLIGYCKSSKCRIVKGKDIDPASHVGLGNLLSPQMWEAKYAPRYYIPWGIILGTYVLNPIILVSSSTLPYLTGNLAMDSS